MRVSVVDNCRQLLETYATDEKKSMQWNMFGLLVLLTWKS
jgi:hypothetical protein